MEFQDAYDRIFFFLLLAKILKTSTKPAKAIAK